MRFGVFGKDVIQAKVLNDHNVEIRFEDNQAGVVNLDEIIKNYEGVFAPLLNQKYFEKISVSKNLGTVCWPNGADIDPEVLYAHVTGKLIVLNQTL